VLKNKPVSEGEPMITIKIKNAEELIERSKGWLVSKALSFAGKSDSLVDGVVGPVNRIFLWRKELKGLRIKIIKK
jgi:hypothetical protein